jgi:hypothetical protein
MNLAHRPIHFDLAIKVNKAVTVAKEEMFMTNNNEHVRASCNEGVEKSKENIKVDSVLRPVYVTPTIITYTDEQLLDELGPAHAGSGISPWNMP